MTIWPTSVTEVIVDNELRCGEVSHIEKSSLTVESTAEITVHLINEEMYTADTTFILPYDSLGTEYYLCGHYHYNIQVVASEPGVTVVNIKLSAGPIDLPSGTYWPGQTATEKIQQYETLNIIDIDYADVDLSGSYLTADKKVAVFAGAYLAQIIGSGTEDHLIEQMIPYNQWGKKFFLISTPGRLIGDMFRVCVAETSTLTLIPGDTRVVYEGTYTDYDIPTNQYTLLESNKAVQVYMFSKSFQSSSSEPRELGDPALTVIPPIQQYLNNFIFSTIKGVLLASYEFYAVAVFPLGKGDGLMWNGQPLYSISSATYVCIYNKESNI